MDKTRMKYYLDLLMAGVFFPCLITGILKISAISKALGLTVKSPFTGPITQIHDWSGFIMGVLVLIHLAVNWKWMAAMTKKAMTRKQVAKPVTNITTRAEEPVL